MGSLPLSSPAAGAKAVATDVAGGDTDVADATAVFDADHSV